MSTDQQLPRWRRPEWVIVYVTVIYVLISGGTLWIIKRQSDLMETQAFHMGEQTKILLDSVAVAKVSAQAAQHSVNTIIAKERARIEVKAAELTVDSSMPFWHIKATVNIRNIGNSRAFITRTASHFFIVRDLKDVDTEELRISSLTLPDDILDPAKEPVGSDIYRFTQTEGESLADLAKDFYEKRVWLLILGFIEYETMGTKWHRDFGFLRESSKGGLWSMLGNPAPDTPEEMLIRGYWNSRSRYPNEEYEMKQEVD